jgi:hypothetical protein
MGAIAQAEGVFEASVASTFDVLAWEIELAGARCIFLDTLIGELMHSLPADRQDRLREGMQTVDLLSQQLTGLSSFARGMSHAVPSEVSAQVGVAIGDITLGALADRMASALGAEEKGVNDGDGAGDLDLF